VLAEGAGFATAMISDHLQPWVPSQGHAGYVWTTIGAIAQATDRLEIGTGVTAMLHRSHPIVVAHAAATASVLLEGRFFLGVGTGERLNEQPFARRWPRSGERRKRLEEAIDVLRQLWSGDHGDGRLVNIDGSYWRVENLRLVDRPASPPPIYVAASGKGTARLAGEAGDGLIAVTPDARLIDAFRGAGGQGPCLAQLHVSLADDIDAAVDNAWRWWPNGAIAPGLLSELGRPEHFEAIANSVERNAIHETVVCATGPDPIVRAINRYVGAGFDTVYLHQVGPDQRRLANLAAAELLPHFAAAP
jgi:G6PDH family F420-dependent oxidoreductase